MNRAYSVLEVKPTKAKSNGRIDGIAALVNALGIAEKGEKPAPKYQMFFA